MGTIASAHAATYVGSIRAPEHAPGRGTRRWSFSRLFRVAMRRQPSRVPETLTAPVHALRLLLVDRRPCRLHVGGDAELSGGADLLRKDARGSSCLVSGVPDGAGDRCGAISRPNVLPIPRTISINPTSRCATDFSAEPLHCQNFHHVGGAKVGSGPSSSW
jgi:hypothetical protein